MNLCSNYSTLHKSRYLLVSRVDYIFLLYAWAAPLAIFLQIDIYKYTNLQNSIPLEEGQLPEKKILVGATRLEIWQIGPIKKGNSLIILVLYIIKGRSGRKSL
jgi:hypothetical protein